MEFPYEEDLSENPFFKLLHDEYHDIFSKANVNGIILCIPCLGSVENSELISLDDILSHILVPDDELPESHFRTLNGHHVKISNRSLAIKDTTTKILFEEIYYTKDFSRYKIFCLEGPLGNFCKHLKSNKLLELKNVKDCSDFLFTANPSESPLYKNFDFALEDFQPSEGCTLKELRTEFERLYQRCLKLAFDEPYFMIKCSVNSQMVENLKLAVETFLQFKTYKRLFRLILSLTAVEDAILNQSLRKSRNDFELPDLLADVVVATIRIDKFSTALEKIASLGKTFEGLALTENEPLSADLLIPKLMMTVVNSNMTGWTAELAFLKNFTLSSKPGFAEEREFLVTTLEATLEQLKLEPPLKLLTPQLATEANNSALQCLFEHVTAGNLSDVKQILEENASENNNHLDTLNLCHPLCNCNGCQLKIQTQLRFCKPNRDSCDDFGRGLLHAAAAFGHFEIVEYLLTIDADLLKTDLNGRTAMQYAAQYGHANVITTMLSKKPVGKICSSLLDNAMNSVLHTAASFGNDDCVEVLLKLAQSGEIHLNVNAVNAFGDTALHESARYGFSTITEYLIQSYANPHLVNNEKRSVFDVAANPAIVQILTKGREIGYLLFKNLEKKNDDEQQQLYLMAANKTYQRQVEKTIKAAFCGDLNLVSFYLRGQPMNMINATDDAGQTVLHAATLNGHLSLLNYILKNHHQINPNLQTRDKLESPLMLACQLQRPEIVRMLLDTGKCDLLLQDRRGNTALHHACRIGNATTAEALLCAAQLQYHTIQSVTAIRNDQGNTPLDEAYANYALSVVALFHRTGSFIEHPVIK